jgi:hypothetical protein
MGISFPPACSWALGALVAASFALAACSERKAQAPVPEPDPAVAAALGEQLMTDPDLARINPENRALGGGGPAMARIPLEDRSPAAVERGRADAARLLGTMLRAPAAAGRGPAPGAGPEALARAVLGQGDEPCVAALENGFGWAARVPGAMPLYPRGHAQQAAGTDRAGCALRVVTILTPVPAGEVADFYWTAATRAGLAPRHWLAGSGAAIGGGKGAGRATAFIAARADGLTEVSLVTSRL